MPDSVVAYSFSGLTAPKFASNFAAGAGCRHVSNAKTLEPEGAVALFPSPPVGWSLYRQAVAEGRDFFYADHGYFGRGDYFRITRNAPQHDGRTGGPDFDRMKEVGVVIQDWKRAGDYVLICPPDRWMARLHGFSTTTWLKNVRRMVRQSTDRPIRLRRRTQAAKRPLQADLARAWVLVTYQSNVAVEALCAGVPVVCTAPCGATRLSTAMARIDSPRYPRSRESWAATLAANQWTMEEIRSGMAWSKLREARCLNS